MDFAFTTRQISGAPSTLGSSPVLSAYVGNSTTELTAGITLSVDFDSRTGLNHVRIVATSGNGYATASDYSVVITTGTVNSVSVVGEVVGDFSIENRQTNVKFWNGGAVSSAATGIPKVDVDTIKTQAVTLSGGITLPAATVASTTNITAGTITTATTATNLTNAPTAGDFTATMKTSIGTAVAASAVASVTGAVGSVAAGGITAASFAAGALDAVWSTAARLLTAGTNIVLAKGTGVTGFNDISTTDVTNSVPTTAQIVAAQNTTQITESYRANGVSPTPAQAFSEILAHLGEASVSGTTKTIKKMDHSTTAETFTLDSGTSPTSVTRTT